MLNVYNIDGYFIYDLFSYPQSMKYFAYIQVLWVHYNHRQEIIVPSNWSTIQLYFV